MGSKGKIGDGCLATAVARTVPCCAVLLGVLAFLLCGALVAGAAGYWSPAEQIGTDDGNDDWSPNVEVSPDGTVWVVWSGTDRTPGQDDTEVFYVTITDTGQSAEALVHPPNGGMDRIPFMSMGADGVPWVIWEVYGDTGYEQAVSYWNGTGWEPPKVVLFDGGRYDPYNIYAADSDDVWVMKSSTAPGRSDRDVFVRHFDGLGWGPVEQLGESGLDETTPVGCRAADGSFWLAWQAETESILDYDICAAQKTAGGWGEPVRIDTLEGNLQTRGIARGSDGELVLVWNGNGHYALDVEHALGTGVGWEYGGVVNDAHASQFERDGAARLSGGEDEELWCVWVSLVYGELGSWVLASQWTGDGWSEEELVSLDSMADPLEDMYPDIAPAPDGRVWSVWIRPQDSTPWDQDVYISCRDETTPVDVWGLSAAAVPEAIALSWCVSETYSDCLFDVWRARADDVPAGGPCGRLPDVAERVTATPVGECTLCECEYVDATTEPHVAYLYWLLCQEDSSLLGPVECIATDDHQSGVVLTVHPNPSTADVSFEITGLQTSVATISIFTVDGRLVRRIPAARGAAGAPTTAQWDGRGAAGERMPRGVYYVALTVAGSAVSNSRSTVVLLR